MSPAFLQIMPAHLSFLQKKKKKNPTGLVRPESSSLMVFPLSNLDPLTLTLSLGCKFPLAGAVSGAEAYSIQQCPFPLGNILSMSFCLCGLHCFLALEISPLFSRLVRGAQTPRQKSKCFRKYFVHVEASQQGGFKEAQCDKLALFTSY